jgi:hypothetical protein
MFEDMYEHFRDGLFGGFNILVDKFQAFFCFLILEARFSAEGERPEQYYIDVERYVHMIDEGEHLLID